MYTQRLLKYVRAHSGLYSVKDIASIWKRGENDVWFSAQVLHQQGFIKNKKGLLHAI